MQKQVMKEFLADEFLKIDQLGIARWKNNNHVFLGKAKIAKLNTKTLLVELTESVASHDGQLWYPKGFVLSLPRAIDPRKWAMNNRFVPEELLFEI